MNTHHYELQTAPLASNLPVILGLLGVWNSTFLGYGTRALLPYSQARTVIVPLCGCGARSYQNRRSQALLRFPAHIQQVDMESNGKRVALDGTPLPFEAGEVRVNGRLYLSRHHENIYADKLWRAGYQRAALLLPAAASGELLLLPANRAVVVTSAFL
jgi:hypothetical protein